MSIPDFSIINQRPWTVECPPSLLVLAYYWYWLVIEISPDLNTGFKSKSVWVETHWNRLHRWNQTVASNAVGLLLIGPRSGGKINTNFFFRTNKVNLFRIGLEKGECGLAAFHQPFEWAFNRSFESTSTSHQLPVQQSTSCVIHFRPCPIHW